MYEYNIRYLKKEEKKIFLGHSPCRAQSIFFKLISEMLYFNILNRWYLNESNEKVLVLIGHNRYKYLHPDLAETILRLVLYGVNNVTIGTYLVQITVL